MTFTPTPEQSAALDLFATGDSLAIEAGAGTGKTSTLRLLAESTSRRGQYVAFNKAIVEEGKTKFPETVACNTAHSLAMRAIGHRYRHRLNSPRMRSIELANRLRVEPIFLDAPGGRKVLQQSYLAGLVMASVGRFCQSADPEPTYRHVPYIDGIDEIRDGRRGYGNNNEVARALEPALRRAWADLIDPHGQLPYKHDHYLKAWQLDGPRIGVDFILFDEAQDANPVMAAIVEAQTHAQRVYVGDSQQAIYGFTGAVNSMQRIREGGGETTFLTQSFRFGPAIADVANEILGQLDAELRLIGTDSIPSVVGEIASSDVVLTRTNAVAVRRVLAAQTAGRSVHLVGGGSEIVSFAKASRELQTERRTGHPELACFDSWGEVQDYVRNDHQGGELRLLVSLVDDFGVETILEALEHTTPEARAELVVSTAHKAKGREWNRVKLAEDFPEEPGPEEKRLLYVAATRAKLQLDVSAVFVLTAGWPPSAAPDEDESDGEGGDEPEPTPEPPVAPTAASEPETAVESWEERVAAEQTRPAVVKLPPSGPQTIEADVVATEPRTGQYGDYLAMIVALDDGTRLCGTVPASIRRRIAPGARVRFDATVKANGYFSRPTGATLVEAQS